MHTSMTAQPRAALHRNLLHHDAQLAHSRDEFQGELSPVDAGGSALVLRPNRVFLDHLRKCRAPRRLDQMGGRVAGWHPPDYLAAVSSLLFRECGEHPGIGAHWKTRFAA